MLRSGLSVVQMPMLPVEPGMTQLMGENVAPSGQRQSLSQIDRLVVVIPNSVRIRVTTIHLSFGQLPNRNVIAEWKYDSCGNSVPHGHTLLISLPQTVLDDESSNGRKINNLRYYTCRGILPLAAYFLKKLASACMLDEGVARVCYLAKL